MILRPMASDLPSADALVAQVRKRFGNGALTLRCVSSTLLVSITDSSGKVQTGGGGTFAAAVLNLLNGGCACA